jgi:hypothetical protein
MTDHAGARAFSPPKALLMAFLVNTVWVNLSEIFRYFVFVRPMMQEALKALPDVAPMNLPVFLSWGVWDTIVVCAITGFSWLYFQHFGHRTRRAIEAGTLVWAAVFLVLWLGLYNMNLATVPILAIALPLAWLEMTVAALIVSWFEKGRRA